MTALHWHCNGTGIKAHVQKQTQVLKFFSWKYWAIKIAQQLKHMLETQFNPWHHSLSTKPGVA